MVRHYVRKRTFTTADRVLVHLSAEALQPAEQSQEGIAAATRCGRSTLTKWLDRLERQALVTRDRVRLPGHPLPKYVYRLTEAGWQAASSLRTRLGTELVTVRSPKLGALSVRLTEVPHLATARLDLTRTVAAVHKGRIDLSKASSTARKEGPIIWGGGLRRVDRFFGREQELRDLTAWWSSSSPALIVTGLAGIGKSALVAAWIEMRSLDVPIYGFETRPSSTAAGFLSDFGAFLASLGKPGLAVHLAQGVPLDPAFVARLLGRDLDHKRVLVIIDNADQASSDLARLLHRLFLGAQPVAPARTVLVGRRCPRWVSLAAPEHVELRRIQGLDHAASRALLRSRGLGPDTTFTEEIVKKTRGHPLLLHLAASTGTGHGPVVRRYLEEEVWKALPAKDRSVLLGASVFRRAVGEHVLEQVAGADHRCLEGLAERNLLERTLAGTYVMHDLVREFVSGRLPEPQRRRFQLRAAAALLRMHDSRDRWEGIYHLLAGGEVAKAAALLDSKEAPLLDCVAAAEIESLVRGLSFDEDDAWGYCVFAEILGDSLRIRGHMGPAIFQYEHARRLAEASGETVRIPRLLRKLAFLERCRNRYPKALGYLVEAQARLQERLDHAEMAEVLREMALVEQAHGDMAGAARHLNEAIDLATDISDRAALSRTLLALGSLEIQRGRGDEGLGLDLEGLRIAERSGNLTEMAHAHVVVGAALIRLGRHEESLKHFSDGFAASRLLGNLRLMAYSTMNRTSALLHLGRLAEAGVTLRESTGYFETLEEEDGIGLLKTYEGELEMGRGHWSRAREAWREGIEVLRAHGNPTELAQVLEDVAGFLGKHGDFSESRSFLLEALEIARRVGDLGLVAEIQADLATLRATPLS